MAEPNKPGEMAEDLAPSKTALKREMTARQELGEALCKLSAKELEKIPIESEDLLEAIRESHRISHHSGLRRHRQYIGKLMRRIDPQPIQEAMDRLYQERRAGAKAFQELEQLRDTLIRDGDKALAPVIDRFPQADRQHLRQLVREAQREKKADKPPTASRRLFRYLRELEPSE
ncbi:MAG: ribosome biogenesis factor YjgA [Pseudomonadota bacterium]